MIKKIFISILLVFVSSNAFGSASCPDSQLLSQKLITDICWGCLFPIKVAGAKLGGGNVPSGASNDIVCSCTDNNGVPHPGIMSGMWEPNKLIELVRHPGCLAAMNGTQLPISKRALGTADVNTVNIKDHTYYHYHYYAFPVMKMLDLYTEQNCFTDGFADFDIMFLSELDPTWNNEALAFFTHPEAAAVANPVAITACSVDAVSSTIGSPTNNMWWCAGSWGTLYPFSGHGNSKGLIGASSLLSAKVMAALHRRGLSRRTMGSDVSCHSKIETILPKTQYKMSMFFPVPEANSSHVIGENEMKWASGRVIPGTGEDAIYVIYRWTDCCNTL